MILAKKIEALEGRTLTDAEIETYDKFEKMFEIGDDDPLHVVLALMTKNHVTVNQLPERLEKVAKETIELHQQTLREQSTLIAKELVVTIGNMVAGSAVGQRVRLALYSGCFMSGFVLGGLCVRLLVR